MPRISTDNYDTVASWNGSQDLFIVEQPDGTKVATPAMVKQFMEAGDFEATGEVKDGHGNILADMAKSVDVKGLAEAGDFEATGEVKDGHGNILNNKCSVATYGWNMGNVTAGSIYVLNNFKSIVGLSDKNIVAVGLVRISGTANYDYDASVLYVNSNDLVRIKTALTQSNTIAYLYIIYTD